VVAVAHHIPQPVNQAALATVGRLRIGLLPGILSCLPFELLPFGSSKLTVERRWFREEPPDRDNGKTQSGLGQPHRASVCSPDALGCSH
jgi:hypothetical protein